MAYKAPAFQLYAAEFLADENFALMSLAGRGAYITLICYCWREGSIPADMNRIGRLCGIDSSAMAELWEELYSCFELANGRYIHPGLERERIKQQEFNRERQESGRRGAQSRWSKVKAQQAAAAEGVTANAPDSAEDSLAIAQPEVQLMAVNGLSSSSSSSSSSPCTVSSLSETDKEETEASRGKPRSASRPTTCDDDFLEELQQNPAYSMFDVRLVYLRMEAWCKARKKLPTRRRFINWLNNEDKPMSVGSQSNGAHPKPVHARQFCGKCHQGWLFPENGGKAKRCPCAGGQQ
jgi:uncharacterized protein YdaU (DUF1376 family)